MKIYSSSRYVFVLVILLSCYSVFAEDLSYITYPPNHWPDTVCHVDEIAFSFTFEIDSQGVIHVFFITEVNQEDDGLFYVKSTETGFSEPVEFMRLAHGGHHLMSLIGDDDVIHLLWSRDEDNGYKTSGVFRYCQVQNGGLVTLEFPDPVTSAIYPAWTMDESEDIHPEFP